VSDDLFYARAWGETGYVRFGTRAARKEWISRDPTIRVAVRANAQDLVTFITVRQPTWERIDGVSYARPTVTAPL
jgi:hypothetical protein